MGFLRLVLDRQRAFMVMELLQLREGLMGSDAMIALVKRSDNAFPRTLMTKDDKRLVGAFEHLFSCFTHAAMGEACALWRGQLRAVSAFAPDQPLTADDSRTVDDPDPISEALRTAPKPNWDKFIGYWEAEHAAGRLSAGPLSGCKSDEELRGRIELLLDKFNEDFLDQLHWLLFYSRYPYQNADMLRAVEPELRPLVEAVEPLPASFSSLQGLDTRIPTQYSIDQLEELRKRGKAFVDAAARKRREVGNAHYTRAAKLTGAQQKQALSAAERIGGRLC